MEDNTQNTVSPAELLSSLAAAHQVPQEVAEQMAVLMQKYPDLSLWGSKQELTDNLEKVVNSAFMNNIIGLQ